MILLTCTSSNLGIRAEFCQRFARAQRLHHLDQVAIDRGRCRVGREPGACPLRAFRRSQVPLQRLRHLDLEGRGRLLRIARLIRSDQRFHLVVVVARHDRQQVAADPLPDGDQRTPRDPARIGMLRRSVDQQRLERCEEKLRRSWSAVGRALGAQFGPQPGLKISRARHIDAALLQPLQLGEQAASRQRTQPLKEFPDSLDPHCCDVSDMRPGREMWCRFPC